VYLYGGEQNGVWDNHTLDAGGSVARYDAPALVLGASNVSFASVRNNLFMNFSDVAGWAGKALITGADTEGSMSSPRIAKADYNAWSNPLASGTGRYLSGIVSGAAGAHDVTAAPRLTGEVPQVPARIDEGSIWSRTYGVSQLLADSRQLYTPAAGSPLVDKGDPADGAGNDIGAIGAGAANAADKFGRVMEAN
jgi:hypothetical protein